jgi:3-carboxy-cis,cis-muconate cycloisomerase
VGDILVWLHDIIVKLEVFPDRMRRNLQLTGGLIMSEAVMMALATFLGRQRAHDIVHEVARTATLSGQEFRDVLAKAVEVSEHLSSGEIAALLDPASHAGCSAEIAYRTAVRAREVVRTQTSKS